VTRFDLHLLARFFSATLLLLALLGVTFVALDYVEYVDDFLDRGASMRQVFGTYYPHYLLDIVRQTSPLAVFLASIYVTARLSQSMQLTALHASGVSLYRVMRPLVLAGLAITAGMLAFNGFVVPRATAVVLDFQNRYYKDAPEPTSGSEVYREVAPGAVLSAGFFDRAEGRAFRVSLVQADTATGALRARLDATEMAWVDSLGRWRFRDVTARTFSPSGAERFETRAELDSSLSVRPRDLALSSRDTERMTIPEARAFVESLERAGVRDRGRPLVAYYAKFSYPVANLLMVLIGVPLAARRRRGGQAVQLAIGLGVAFVYLALQKVVEPLGFVETIPPVVAAWLPHGVFAVVAVVMLGWARRT
jgi:lipopolysaccharide export system permease protein